MSYAPPIHVVGRGDAVDNYLVGQTNTAVVRYVQDQGGEPVQAEEKVLIRLWDVTDPKARNLEAARILGGGALPRVWAQWFIDPAKNAAAFCVYRKT